MSNGRLAQQLQNKKILITGGDGFLGSHLLYQISQVCKNVSLYQGDIRDIGNFRKSYDIVCHLAALNKVNSGENVSLLFDVNVNGTLAVMRYCFRVGAKCIFASSAAVYKPVTNKKFLSENSCIGPISLYGVSKMLAESICRYHAENFGVPVIALRIFNMYGPYQKNPFLIPHIIDRLSKNKPVLLKEPKLVRDFVYVTDVAKAFILSCANRQKRFIILNLGTGQPLSIYQVAQRIARYMKAKVRIRNEFIKNSKRNYVVADMSTALKVINWHPLISFDKGVALIANKEYCKN